MESAAATDADAPSAKDIPPPVGGGLFNVLFWRMCCLLAGILFFFFCSSFFSHTFVIYLIERISFSFTISVSLSLPFLFWIHSILYDMEEKVKIHTCLHIRGCTIWQRCYTGFIFRGFWHILQREKFWQVTG